MQDNSQEFKDEIVAKINNIVERLRFRRSRRGGQSLNFLERQVTEANNDINFLLSYSKYLLEQLYYYQNQEKPDIIPVVE